MYLKSIELCGFKSFADRTILNFEKHITAIVGPNGCGKSNIVDSIRWVLGEQSAYSLRTPQMLGVIFNGSQTRGPLNLAEVSITFDNSSNILPIDYTEVTVTRKLFRSGESEYYINKTQCRLKDIRDLFLDTGIGREGYSIFEQGKVEFITTAKPEERRALFEEAAGVAKYKVKREETLRKLEKVHENMNRVNDVMGVIKEQINSLEGAVRKAKLFQKYQEELKTLEIADITKKIGLLEKELLPLTTEIESLNKEQIQKSTQINTLESELSNLQYEKTNVERELSELYRNLSQTNAEIAHAEEKIENSKERVKEFKERQVNLKNEIQELVKIRKNTEEAIKKITEELNAQSEIFQKITTEYETKKKEYEDLKSHILKNQNKLSNLNKHLFDIIFEKTSINNEIGKINSNITSISYRISSLNSELKKILNEKTNLENEIQKSGLELSTKNEELNKAQKSYDEFIKISTDLEEKLNLKKRYYAEIKEKYSALNSRIETIKELEKSNPKLRPVYSVLSQNFTGIHGTVRTLISFPSHVAPLINNFLGEKLNYIVCDNVSSANSAIEYLEKNKLGWASFIVLEMLPDIQEKKFFGQLKGEKPIKSLISYEPKWEKLVRFLFSNTYFSGSNIFSEGILHGGSIEPEQNPELQLTKFEDELLKLQEEIKNTESEIQDITENLKTQKEKLNLVVSEQQQLKLNINILNSELENKNQKLKLVNIEYETVQKEIEQLNNEKNEIERQLPDLQNKLQEAESKIKEIQIEISNLEKEILELREKEQSINPEYSESTKKYLSYETQVNSYKRELSTLTENLKIYESRTKNSEDEIKNLDEKIIEQENIFSSETKKIEKLYEKQTEIEKKISEIRQQENSIDEKIEQKQKKLSILRNDLNTLQVKLHELQISNKTKEIEKTSLEKKLQEFGIEYNDAKETYSNIEVDEEQIQKLKKKIDSIGAVNLAAQEQYTDLEKRYNFLLEQQQDLIKAEEDLKQAINKINSSIRENFQETFNRVRENFKKIFSQLFEGGESDLILTDENNLLESGVEIIAQPPGKKLQNITLLSGGEKALTAIALLFSFFMVKPSPVCILDEVDAPLDDANITRFLNLIKSFGETTQFLIITHNKRTIESADIIYGVTMEEYGISKIISLRLQKIESAPSGELEKVTTPAL